MSKCSKTYHWQCVCFLYKTIMFIVNTLIQIWWHFGHVRKPKVGIEITLCQTFSSLSFYSRWLFSVHISPKPQIMILLQFIFISGEKLT